MLAAVHDSLIINSFINLLHRHDNLQAYLPTIVFHLVLFGIQVQLTVKAGSLLLLLLIAKSIASVWRQTFLSQYFLCAETCQVPDQQV